MALQSPSMPPAEVASQAITTDAWIMVGLTALTLLFAVWSWWSANKSKAARIAAETAEEKAERRVGAAEATASELRKLVESLQLPALVATATKPRGATKIMLRNTTGEAIAVVNVVNMPDFVRLDTESPLPFTIHSGAQFGMDSLAAHGFPAPSNLHLRIRDSHGERDVHVPIPHVS